MIATFRNIASTLNITLIFSLVTVGLVAHLPNTLLGGLTSAGIPQEAATLVSHLPPIPCCTYIAYTAGAKEQLR